MKLDVHLPSGSGCSFSFAPDTPVSELKAAAQQHFQRRLKLSAQNRPLELTATLGEAGLRDGDLVQALIQPVKLAATAWAFALHVAGGDGVAWGLPDRGGDSSQVQEQLRNVRQIQATSRGAFAAILESGAVVTWGDPRYGGNSSQSS
ncbi:unnamed protein product [Effrenium voratum]|uniref:Ubiquitin-like domain-containing protein n=1 Tax=Effrenium voratum TaxID=2562239 RepID=A0AA36HS97_9DINO|nr:unnamed protein product [Effrenium voratum]